MKCPFCMEEIADNSEKCALCTSELMKPCPYCMEKIKADALKCKLCGSMLDGAPPQQQAMYTAPVPPQPHVQPVQQQMAQPPQSPVDPPQFPGTPVQDLPTEARGWCWGGFLLTWIWAIGNKTWIGLLGLIPILNLVMMFVLGAKGREWAWKNGQWRDVEHFNAVQKKWTIAGVILIVIGLVGGILSAVAIPQFSAYKVKGYNSAAQSDLRNASTMLESYLAANQKYPDTLEASKFVPANNVYVKCSILPDAYVCGAAHKQGTTLFVRNSVDPKISEHPYKTGEAIQLPFDPRPLGSAKADEAVGNAALQTGKTPTLDETLTFMKKWGELQSNKDVSGYLAMYATDFRGIKRTTSGKTTYYNFQGWAADRTKMYERAKSISVVADEVRVTGTDEAMGVTTAEFVQRYNSDTYCDKGRKVIKIRRDGNELKIVHEELLFSQKTDCGA
jgi:Tfp pilus assembly protein PilE